MKIRTARPGDICVLLEPTEAEFAQLRQLQIALQSLFGGRPHQRVHLTCQRFVLQEVRLLPDIIQHMKANLATIQPFPITAISLSTSEHHFWQSRLLRWHIKITNDVRRFVRLVEDGLTAVEISPHFPQAEGWMPTRVTALEAIPGEDLDSRLSVTEFPQHLFTGRQVILSKIIGPRQFEILETIQLEDK